MAEYIELEAAIEIFEQAFDNNWEVSGTLDRLRAIPAADVAPVRHGQFLGTEFDGYADGLPVYYEWQCSECGRIFEDEEPTYEFCPWCGAKMDGGQDDV